MVLFKQNSDESIEVYTFDQNNYLISKYKEEQLKRIPDYEKFYVMKESQNNINDITWIEANENILEQSVFDIKDLNREYKDKIYSFKIDKQFNEIKRNELINEYILGINSLGSPMFQVKCDDTMKYFLLLNERFIFDKGRTNIKIYNGIIQLPESLYLLELVRNKKFTLVQNKDIRAQLNALNFKHVGKYTKDDWVYSLINEEDKVEKINYDLKKLLKK